MIAQLLVGLAFGFAIAAIAWRRLELRSGAVLALVTGGVLGAILAFGLGSRAVLGGASLAIGVAWQGQSLRTLIVRVATIAVAAALSTAVGAIGVLLLAWIPRRDRAQWVAVALGLIVIAVISWIAARAIDPIAAAEALLALAAGALAATPLSRWMIGPSARASAFVALYFLPALAVLAFSVADRGAWSAPDDVWRALGFGLVAATMGAIASAACVGGIAILASAESAKSEIMAMLVVPAVMALTLGAVGIAVAAVPLALGIAVGVLILASPVSSFVRG